MKSILQRLFGASVLTGVLRALSTVLVVALMTCTARAETKMLYHLDFEGATDAERIANHGSGSATPTKEGTLTFDAHSGFGSAVKNNSGYIKIADAAGLGCSTESGFTISFFVKCSAGDRWQTNLGFRVGGMNVGFMLDNGGATVTCHEWDASRNTFFYDANVWQHFALVYENNCPTVASGATRAGRPGFSIYRNGVWVGYMWRADTSGDRMVNGNLTEVLIGRGRNNAGGATAGMANVLPSQFDEVAVFDRSLNAEQILELSKGVAAVPTEPRKEPKVLYQLDFEGATDADRVENRGSGSAVPAVEGTLTYESHSGFGSAVKNNSGYIKIADVADLGCSTESGFTISFFVKRPPASSVINWQTNLGFRVGALNVGFMEDNSDHYTVTCHDQDNEGWRNTFSYQADTWQHFAFVYERNCPTAADGATRSGAPGFSIYCDGVWVGYLWRPLIADKGTFSGNLTEVLIGRGRRNDNGGGAGATIESGVLLSQFDDVTVFDRSLTKEQISALSKSKVVSAKPQMLYHLDYDGPPSDAKNGVDITNSGTGTIVPEEVGGGYRGYASSTIGGWCSQLHRGIARIAAPTGIGCSTEKGFTLSFYLKSDRTAEATLFSLFGFRVGDNNFSLDKKAAEQKYVFTTTGSGFSSSVEIPCATAGQWQHFSIVYVPAVDASAARYEIYSDGIKAGALTGAATGALTEVIAGRGRSTNAADGALKAASGYDGGRNSYIDEVAVFNAPLTASQLLWLSMNRATLPPAQLLYQIDYEGNSEAERLSNRGNGPMVGRKVATTGTGSGDFVFEPTGKFGSGAGKIVDSTSGVLQIVNSAGLGCSTTTGFTLSFYLKKESAGGNWRRYFGFRVGDKNVYLMKNASEQYALAYPEQEAGNRKPFNYKQDGQWQHLAIVYEPACATNVDGSTRSTAGCAVYLDGVWAGYSLVSAVGNVTELLIGNGRKTNAADSSLEEQVPSVCYFDEVSLFDRSLNADEIAALAAKTADSAVLPMTLWTGTVEADVAASALTVTNGTETKALSALTREAVVTLTVTKAATLTMDTACTFELLSVTGQTLTVGGSHQLTVKDLDVRASSVVSNAGALVATEVRVAAGKTLGFAGDCGICASKVAGSGAVAVLSGATLSLTGANSYSGGTAISGTLNNVAGATFGSGLISVLAGGSLDLNGADFTSALTLAGGTVLNSVASVAPATAPKLAGNLTLTADSAIEVANAIVLGSGSSAPKTPNLGGFKLTKRGVADVSLNGINTNGTVGGTLSVGAGSVTWETNLALPLATIEVATGATFKIGESATGANWLAEFAGLKGTGSVDLADLKTLKLSGAGAYAFTGTLTRRNADLVIEKSAMGAQSIGALPTVGTAADLRGVNLTVAAGNLDLASAATNVVELLSLTGGTLMNNGAGAVTVQSAEMSSGSVLFLPSAVGTARTARPLAISKAAVSVANFTLAADGIIQYKAIEDFNKWFPKGFISDYAQLTVELTDVDGLTAAMTFPYTFKLLGVPESATIKAIKGTNSEFVLIDGLSVTLTSPLAFDVTLPRATHHYTFDRTLADSGSGGVTLNGEGGSWTDSDAGQALVMGTPYNGVTLANVGTFTVSAMIRGGTIPEKGLFFGLGNINSRTLLVYRGAGDTICIGTAPNNTAATELFRVPAPNLGIASRLVTLTRQNNRLTLFLDGERIGDVAFADAIGAAGFQVGKIHGGLLNSGLKDGTGGVMDDLRIYKNVAFGKSSVQRVLAEIATLHRWHTAALAAEAFNPAATDWKLADGTSGRYDAIPSGVRGRATALVTFTQPVALAEVMSSMASLTALSVAVDGAALTVTPTSLAAMVPIAKPASVANVGFVNPITIDLQHVKAALVAAWLADPTLELGLLQGRATGALTVLNAPEGFTFTLDPRADGFTYVKMSSTLFTGLAPSIAVNFGAADALAAETLYGLSGVQVLGKHWNVLSTTSGVEGNNGNTQTATFTAPVTVNDVAGATLATTIETDACDRYELEATWNPLLRGILGDYWASLYRSERGWPQIRFKNVPYSRYTCFLYMADSAGGWDSNGSITLNAETSKFYFMAPGSTKASIATTNTKWGNNKTKEPILGQNVIKISDMTGAELTLRAWRSNGLKARANISAVQLVSSDVYTRTLSANGSWSSADAWTLAGSTTTADQPSNGAAVLLTLTRDCTLTVDAPLTLSNLVVLGGHTLTLEYSDAFITDADYLKIRPLTPFVTTLLSGHYDLATVKVTLPLLKYAASATIAQSSSRAIATVTLPPTAFPEQASISVNFADGNDFYIPNEEVSGYLPVAGKFWTQVGICSSPTAVKQYDGIRTSEVASALTAIKAGGGGNLWSNGNNKTVLLRRYLDDDNSSKGPDIRLTLPDAFATAGYTVVVYASADNIAANHAFPKKTVNGTAYTYDAAAHKTVAGDALWGHNGTLTPVEGENYLVIEGQRTNPLTILSSPERGYRGTIAGFQVIKNSDPTLVPAYRATLSGTANWGALSWTKEGAGGGVAPSTGDTAVLILAADATLTFDSNVTLGLLRVIGNGHTLRLVDRTKATVTLWIFSPDLTFVLGAEGETLPTTVAYPKRVRYDYPVTAATVTTPLYETELAKGKSGALTLAGGTVEFSGGNVAWAHDAERNMNPSGTQTTVLFTGAVNVSATHFAVGTATMLMRDAAALTCEGQFMLSDGGAGRTANFTMEGDASVTVTGSTNVDSNKATILFGHWDGPSMFTLKERATFTAENADVLIGKTANNHVLNLDGGMFKVRGIKLAEYASGSNTLNLNGGTLILGTTGLDRYGSTVLHLNVRGSGSRLLSTVPSYTFWNSEAVKLDGELIFEPRADQTITLPSRALWTYGAHGGWTLDGAGTLSLGAMEELPTLISRQGTLALRTGVSRAPALTLEGGIVDLKGSFVTVGALTLPVAPKQATIRLPLVEDLSQSGYLSLGKQAIPAVSQLVFELVLDPNRPSSSKVLPQVPLILGTYGASPSRLGGFGITNNTNGAISTSRSDYLVGDSGSGLYALLDGTEVLKPNSVKLTNTRTYTLIQRMVDAYPFLSFIGQETGSLLGIPAGGIDLPHASFVGNTIRIVAQSAKPECLLRGSGYTFATDTTFDLSAWGAAMPEMVRGAVQGIPMSFCLISGAVMKASPTVKLSVTFTDQDGTSTYELPSGFTGRLEQGDRGLYYVVRSERRVQTVSLNFTRPAVPTLQAPPARLGVYPINVNGWNSLLEVFTSTVLCRTDLGGGRIPTEPFAQIFSYASQTAFDVNGVNRLLKVWLDDAAEQRVRVTAPANFTAYRVALICATDKGAYVYPSLSIGGRSYTMDGDYVRTNVKGDSGWGNTTRTPADTPVLLGTNALVSDVFTERTVEIVIPPYLYGKSFGGLAALQLIDAPEISTAATAQSFSYAFTAAQAETTVKLADLTLTGAGDRWVNGPNNILTLLCDVAVTLELPSGFEADRLLCSGSGHLTLVSEGGVALNALSASGLANLTVGFDCLGTVYFPAQRLSRFEKLFDNVAQPYLIAEGATLALGKKSGITTNYDKNVTAASAVLKIDAASVGVLRRDYPVAHSDTSACSITFAYANGFLDAGGYWYADLLVEEGDEITTVNQNLWVRGGTTATHRMFRYTQTGGTMTLNDGTGNNHGFLLTPSGGEGVDGTFVISGGRLHVPAILAWASGSQVTIAVSGTGTLSLWHKLHSENAPASLRATFSEGGTLELANDILTKYTPAGPVTVTFNGGRLTMVPSLSTMTLPVIFAATDAAPTLIDLPLSSTLILNAVNSGSGAIRLSGGTVAAAHASALAAATLTVARDATFEPRLEMSTATLNLEAGATVNVVRTTPLVPGANAYRVANRISFASGVSASDVTWQYRGVAYRATVNAAAGTVTFGSDLSPAAVSWAVASGIWTNGIVTPEPWSSGTFKNGAAVTFGSAGAGVSLSRTVDVRGRVAPSSLTLESLASGGYRFTEASTGGMIDLSKSTAALLSLSAAATPTQFEVPIALPSHLLPADGINLQNTTVRLVGALSRGNKEARYEKAFTQSGHSEPITFSPRAGEVQTLRLSEGPVLEGSSVLTVCGQGAADGSVSGGTLSLIGNSTVRNAVFAGSFVVKDGATLGFDMTNGVSNNAPFFQHARFKTALCTKSHPAVTLMNGATVRVSGSSGQLFGQWVGPAVSEHLRAYPYSLGENCTLYVSIFGNNNRNWIPHSFYFTGNNSRIVNDTDASGDNGNNGFVLMAGARLTVAGIDGAITNDVANIEMGGKAIEAYLVDPRSNKGMEIFGLAARQDMEGVFMEVGEGSTLHLQTRLTIRTAGVGDATPMNLPLIKVGKGRSSFEWPSYDFPILVEVREGRIGGFSEFANVASTMVVKSGSGIEAGLRPQTLTLESGATLYVDLSGNKVLSPVFAAFGAASTIHLEPLGTDIPVATVPIKVMGWQSVQNVSTVQFVLAKAISDQGYALEIRSDGLYLKRIAVYHRTLAPVKAPVDGSAFEFPWYDGSAWTRDADPALRDFDPLDTEAAVAEFTLGEHCFTATGAVRPLRLLVTRPVNVATVRFIKAASGEAVTPPVTYLYDLLNEAMPAEGDVKSFAWIPMLGVEGASAPAMIDVKLPTGYEAVIRENVAIVHRSTEQAGRSLNVKFGAKAAGTFSYIDAALSPCGAVPLAGIYWNNGSTQNDTQRAVEPNYTAYEMLATPVGSKERVQITYVVQSAGAKEVARKDSPNNRLLGSFLPGKVAKPTADFLTNCGLSNPMVNRGWQVKVEAVPYLQYDLYLIFAGTEDRSVYPAIRLKVGDGAWHSYSQYGGFTVPSGAWSAWVGRGGLAADQNTLMDGVNYLHLRIAAPKVGAALEFCSSNDTDTVGLAAMQIVPCRFADGRADGAEFVSPTTSGSGYWFTEGGWRMTDESGATKHETWRNATVEAPYAAVLPSGGEQILDQDAVAATLRFRGAGEFKFSGEGKLRTAAIDFNDMSAHSTVHLNTRNFVGQPIVALAPEVTFTLGEELGAVTNDWRWMYDDVSRDAPKSTTSQLVKAAPADLTISYPIHSALDIQTGTLWLGGEVDYTYNGESQITGAGRLGKSGSNQISVRYRSLKTADDICALCKEGVLRLYFDDNDDRALPEGKTIVAEGNGTVLFEKSGSQRGAFVNGTILARNGGKIAYGFQQWDGGDGDVRFPLTILDNGSWQVKQTNDTRTGPLTLRNGGKMIFEDGVIIFPYRGTIAVDSGIGFLTRLNAGVTVGGIIMADGTVSATATHLLVKRGATLDSDVPVARGYDVANRPQLNGVMNFGGGGTWIQRTPIAGDIVTAILNVKEGGTLRFLLGAATQNPTNLSPITVEANGRLEGTGIFGANAPLVVQEATLRSGAPGATTGQLSLTTLTLGEKSTLECDLANSDILTITGTVNTSLSLPNALTVKLLNFGSTLSTARKLVAWSVTPAPSISGWSSMEAAALNATLESRTDGLWLVPTASAYVWKEKATGNWSDTNWTTGGSATLVIFPNVEENPKTANVPAKTGDVALTVDDRGHHWTTEALVLDPSAGKKITLAASDASLALARKLTVKKSLWKLNSGAAEFSAPIVLGGVSGRAAAVNIAGGTVTQKVPFKAETISTGEAPGLSAALSIGAGAEMIYEMTASDVQTWRGVISGSGLLRQNGADTTVTLASSTDNDLSYDVQAGTLVLSGNDAARLAARSLTVAAAGTVLLTTEKALGGSPEWTLNLEAGTSPNGAKVQTSSSARVGGTIRVTGSGTAAFGGETALVRSSTFDVGAGATLEMNGNWLTPERTPRSTLKKTGEGTLAIRGSWLSCLPMEVERGSVLLSGSLTPIGNNVEPLMLADWTFRAASRLQAAGGTVNLNGGLLRFDSGSEVELRQPLTIVGESSFGASVTVAMADATLPTLKLKGRVTFEGPVILSLPPMTIPDASTGHAYTLVVIDGGTRAGAGRFQLGGAQLQAWAEKGWTVKDDGGTQVTLAPIGNGTDVYTWAGVTEGAGNWGTGDTWLKVNGTKLVAWPDPAVSTGVKPSATLQDLAPLAPNDPIPASARTLDWTLPRQMLSGFRCANSLPASGDLTAHDYTVTGSGDAATMEVEGDFMKTGTAALTLRRPVSFVSAAATLRLLGGTTVFEKALTYGRQPLDIPVTLMGDAKMVLAGGDRYALNGPLFGDGRGIIEKSGGNSLSIGASLDSVKEVKVTKGAVVLTSSDRSIQSKITLVPGIGSDTVERILTYAPDVALDGSEPVTLAVNEEAVAPVARTVFEWAATSSVESTSTPRLEAPVRAPALSGAALKVATFRYKSARGHLVLNANAAVIGAETVLDVVQPTMANALWIGATVPAGVTPELKVAGLTGIGALSTEPRLGSSEAWNANRFLTVALSNAPAGASAAEIEASRTFSGTVAGNSVGTQVMRMGLRVMSATTDGTVPRFVLAGSSTAETLGTLEIAAGAEASVIGTWGGTVDVKVGGRLSGNGTVGVSGRKVTVPAGGALCGSFYGSRKTVNNLTVKEVIPATLKVKGTLDLTAHSQLQVLIRRDHAMDDAPWVSRIEAETVRVPVMVEDTIGNTASKENTNEIKLDVILDIEAGAAAANVKILGWKNREGSPYIFGRVYESATDFENKRVSSNYSLRCEGDGLYLRRANARFWMFIQ